MNKKNLRPKLIHYPIQLLCIETKERLFLLASDLHLNLDNKQQCVPCQKPDCMSFEDWIVDFGNVTNVLTDVFIETNLQDINDQQLKGMNIETQELPDLPIVKLQTRFEKCIKKDKEECKKFGNMRIHATDPRVSINDDVTEIFYTKIQRYMKGKKYDSLNLPSARILTNIYKKYVDEILDGKWNEFFPTMKINKQFHSLPKILQKKFKLFFEKYAYDTMVIFRENYRLVRFLPHTINSALATGLWNLMDIYLLSRVFKPSLETKIVIIYAGHAHIELYEAFLKSQMKGKVLFRQIGNQCLHLNEENWNIFYDKVHKFS
jgi:hypothetical protein